MSKEDMKEIDKKQFDELRNIGRLANEFLEKYCHPHSVIEINEDGIMLTETLIFIPRRDAYLARDVEEIVVETDEKDPKIIARINEILCPNEGYRVRVKFSN